MLKAVLTILVDIIIVDSLGFNPDYLINFALRTAATMPETIVHLRLSIFQNIHILDVRE